MRWKGRARRPEDRVPPRRRRAVIAGLLVVVFVLQTAVGRPAIGLPQLYLVPTALAAAWFGLGGALATGLLAAVLHGAHAALAGEEGPLVGATFRLAVFSAAGALVAWLFEQRTSLRAVVAERDHQIEDLRVIREALVPSEVPRRQGLELATAFVAAERNVSGDFYLVADGPEDATVVVVGDAVGKGIEAARRASFVRASLATFCAFTSNPARLLEMANYSLLERAGASDGAFVTAACVALRPADGQMAWALAGHPPPLRMDDGEPLEGGRPGLPLGLELDLDIRVDSGLLPRGEGLLLYTDGLIEARQATAGKAPRSLAGNRAGG
jgi:hypothetical protein